VDVDRGWLWIVLAVTCVPATAMVVRHRLRTGFYAAHGRWLEAPLAFAAVLADGVLTGVGTGIAITLAVVLAGAGLTVLGL
jgi:hypothetical protein